jgi:hypothetical protein
VSVFLEHQAGLDSKPGEKEKVQIATRKPIRNWPNSRVIKPT